MKCLLNHFNLNSLKLANRIVMAPMTRKLSKDGVPGYDTAQYYRKRAQSGVGLIITEGTVIEHKAANGYANVPHFYGEAALAGWAQVVHEVQEAGGKIFPQLWHVGSVRQSQHQTDTGQTPGFAPSSVPHPYIDGAEVPHEMTHQDIADVIQAFAQAAKAAKDIGFDGIEIHGAHGYLIDQFFWAHTNKRTDQYGGKSLSQRTRFAVEIIQSIRDAVGPDFPIDFRFSQWKLGDYEAKLALNPQELESFLLPLSDAGVDIFHCSTRRFWEPEFTGYSLNLAGWTKKITGKPTMAVGSVGLDIDFVQSLSDQASSAQQTPNRMQHLFTSLEHGEFDLIALGRALLADPEWLHKTMEDRSHDIIPFTHASLSKLT